MSQLTLALPPRPLPRHDHAPPPTRRTRGPSPHRCRASSTTSISMPVSTRNDGPRICSSVENDVAILTIATTTTTTTTTTTIIITMMTTTTTTMMMMMMVTTMMSRTLPSLPSCRSSSTPSSRPLGGAPATPQRARLLSTQIFLSVTSDILNILYNIEYRLSYKIIVIIRPGKM